MTKELFIKYLQGKCCETEFQQFLDWIKEEAILNSDRGVIQEIWDEFEPEAGPDERIKYNRILDKIHHNLNLNPNQFILHNKSLSSRVLSFMTNVAAILLLPVLSWQIYNFLSDKEKTPQKTNDVVVQASAGSMVNFELSDGTKVWLNHGSKLRYPNPFSEKYRKVFLTGEAYFVVAHNNEVPFVIETNKLEVKAVGTSFNVSAYPEDEEVEVALVEGKVILSERDTKQLIKAMNPSESINYNCRNNNYSVELGSTNKYTAWKEGRLVFRNDSLAEIAKKLARWFNVDIEITDRRSRQFTYTATFTNETLAQVLDLMTIPTPVSYKLSKILKLSDGSYTKQKVIIGLKKNS